MIGGIPLEVFTMLGSGLLGGLMRLWSRQQEDRAAAREHELALLAERRESLAAARSHDAGVVPYVRAFLAIVAVLTVLTLPKVAGIWYGVPVTVTWTELDPGWLWQPDRELLRFRTVEGVVYTPLDSHFLFAVAGFYFGTTAAGRGREVR